MLSTIPDVPLQIRRILEYGSSWRGEALMRTAVGLDGAGRILVDEVSYRELARNASRLAAALAELGVGPDDRVATFMWNSARHVEAYFAVPGMGAVLHPLNIRLEPDQIVFIANHAEDKVVIVDGSLVPAFAPLLPRLKTVEQVIVAGPVRPADLDALRVPAVTVHRLDELTAGQPGQYPWPDVDERQAAAMCYTSGTTGEPKGVVYSHRSIYLHTMALLSSDNFALSQRDILLVVVPQFHVLAWGLPYAAVLTGMTMALPGPFLAPEPLAAFIAAARPTIAAGVPTIWRGLIDHVEAHPEADISTLRECVVGGSACSPALMAAYDRHGITLVPAWGMTEMSPLGSVARPPAGLDEAETLRYRHTQGRLAAGVEARLIGSDGRVQPHDGVSPGELEVRGPWITGSYFRDDDPSRFDDGWLRTGDVGVIDPRGFLTLTDRAKDIIKSGGEWISSINLENHLMDHPAVAEAAVIGVPDDRWGERPLACVVPRAGHRPAAADGADGADGELLATLRAFLAERVPRWQIPERWAIVDEVPKTSVGKFDKLLLRRRVAGGAIRVTGSAG
jgi:fatty-acyl-CoA synthase